MAEAASRFARLGRWPARLILALLVLLVALALINPPTPIAAVSGDRQADRADVLLYEHIIERVQAGENYYHAAAAAQRAGGYPLKPFLVVRPPLLAWVEAGLGLRNAALLFYALFAAMLAAWAWRLKSLGWDPAQIILGILLVAGGGATLLQPDLLTWHDAWAALLIALSLALRSDRRVIASIVVALAAALIRETAILFPAIMGLIALSERRWREAALWAGAGAIWTAAIVWHAAQVAAVVRPDDPASPGWSAMGGWRFVVSMLWLTGPLRLAPFWTAALLVPLALLGWLGWRTSTGARGALALCAYCTVFALLGRPDNFYWGFLIAPLLPLGLLRAPTALRDLARQAR